MKAFVLTLAGLLLPTFAALAEPATTSTARVVDLRVERMTNPTAVNHPLPRFGWRIETEELGYLQASYQILAASSPELLAQGNGDLWDSEEKPGRKSQFIDFGGAPLTTGQSVYWKARSKDRTGKFTPWSDPASFTIKLSGPPELPTPLFLPVSESPRLSSFECSDPNLNKIFKLAGERLHEITSVRDVGLAMRAAAYHQEIHPRASAWLHHINSSVDAADFYPATLPSDGTYGSTQSDAAISATHSLWWMTGDTAIPKDSWDIMYNYFRARRRFDAESLGRPFGKLPGDTLPTGDPTPPEFIHLSSLALDARLLHGMAKIGSSDPFCIMYIRQALAALRDSFSQQHIRDDDAFKYRSITAHLYALRSGLSSEQQKATQVATLLNLIKESIPKSPPIEESPFAGFNLLPVLSWTGNVDQAVEIARRSDPEDLSPMALAGISEWLTSMLGGIETEDLGFQHIRIRPYLSSPELVSFSRARYESMFGPISVHWKNDGITTCVNVSTPPNTTLLMQLPGLTDHVITENGQPIENSRDFTDLQLAGDLATFRALPGTYHFKITRKQSTPNKQK